VTKAICSKSGLSSSTGQPQPFGVQLRTTGFLRLSQIIGNRRSSPPIPPIIPVSRSTWYQGVKSGRFPAPIKTLGPKIAVYRAEDILALLDPVEGAIAATEKRHHGYEK